MKAVRWAALAVALCAAAVLRARRREARRQTQVWADATDAATAEGVTQ